MRHRIESSRQSFSPCRAASRAFSRAKRFALRLSRVGASDADNQLGPCAAAEDIEELASDVFVALWRAPQPLRTEHLRGWLGKVARNQAISFLRRQHLQLVRDEDCILIDDRDAQKLLEAKERSALLNAALAALTSEDREIFLRRYYYNQTAGQIAEALHMNPSTVRSRLLRGRQSLRTELQKGDVQIEDLCAESV